jgi:hypothetical protein
MNICRCARQSLARIRKLSREKMSAERESVVIGRMFPDAPTEAIRFVGHQINVVDNMGQGLMGLGGILLAITTSLLPSLKTLASNAKSFIVIGSTMVLASILCNAVFVFRIRWITQMVDPSLDHEKTMLKALRIRSAKTRAYHCSLGMMIIGLLCYLLSM